MDEIKLPYKIILQKSTVKIEAFQMTNDIENHLKRNLKKKVEKKCNQNGFVDEVYKITNKSNGFMPGENFDGSAIFYVTYQCRLYLPIENTIIISQIKMITHDLIVSINGPIMSIIPPDNIDFTIWEREDYLNKGTKTKLNIGDFVKIQILHKKLNENDTTIKTQCKLLNFASEKEIEMYYNIHKEESINKEQNNFII